MSGIVFASMGMASELTASCRRIGDGAASSGLSSSSSTFDAAICGVFLLLVLQKVKKLLHYY